MESAWGEEVCVICGQLLLGSEEEDVDDDDDDDNDNDNDNDDDFEHIDGGTMSMLG